MSAPAVVAILAIFAGFSGGLLCLQLSRVKRSRRLLIAGSMLAGASFLAAAAWFAVVPSEYGTYWLLALVLGVIGVAAVGWSVAIYVRKR